MHPDNCQCADCRGITSTAPQSSRQVECYGGPLDGFCFTAEALDKYMDLPYVPGPASEQQRLFADALARYSALHPHFRYMRVDAQKPGYATPTMQRNSAARVMYKLMGMNLGIPGELV